MRAIILAAGKGTRLLPLSNDIPKCLVKIDDKTILDHAMDSLSKMGVLDFTILVGLKQELVRGHIKENYPELNVSFVFNPLFESTNYIYSLHLLSGFIDEDVLVLHGDLVFDEILCKRLIEQEQNCVLLKDEMGAPEKDFKGLVESGRVRRIGVGLSGENTYFLAPFYRLKRDDFQMWIERIEKFINEGKVMVYAEDALNEILDDIYLVPEFFNSEFCMEVDDMSDLEMVRSHFNQD